jgi:hypothetical protein
MASFRPKPGTSTVKCISKPTTLEVVRVRTLAAPRLSRAMLPRRAPSLLVGGRGPLALEYLALRQRIIDRDHAL